VNIVIDTVFLSNEHQNQSKTIIFDRRNWETSTPRSVSAGAGHKKNSPPGGRTRVIAFGRAHQQSQRKKAALGGEQEHAPEEASAKQGSGHWSDHGSRDSS
jgi:hypothetical protein